MKIEFVSNQWVVQSEYGLLCSYCQKEVSTPFYLCASHKKSFCSDCMAATDRPKDSPLYKKVECHNVRYSPIFTHHNIREVIQCDKICVRKFSIIKKEAHHDQH